MQYTLDWVRDEVARLKANGGGRPRVHSSRPGNARVHPNGFIQLDLEPTEATWHESHHEGHSGANLRLHIWNPPGHKLPHQGTFNELHTHVFDMHSNVVRGKMNQRIYTFAVGSEWWTSRAFKDPKVVKDLAEMPEFFKLYKAVYAKSADSRLEDTGIRGVVIEDFDFAVSAGQSYYQPAFTFHDSDPEGCTVTVMEKTEVHPGDAHVLIPNNIEPDNSYDRATAAPVEYLWEAIEAALA
jgi:hypothetical protein